MQVWKKTPTEHLITFNTFSWVRREVVRLPEKSDQEFEGGEMKRARMEDDLMQTLHDGSQIGEVA